MIPRGPARRDRGGHVVAGVRGTTTCARVGAVPPAAQALGGCSTSRARLRARHAAPAAVGHPARARRGRLPRIGQRDDWRTCCAGRDGCDGPARCAISQGVCDGRAVRARRPAIVGAGRYDPRDRRDAGDGARARGARWSLVDSARRGGGPRRTAGRGPAGASSPGGRSRSPPRCIWPAPSRCTTGCSRSSPPPPPVGRRATPTSSSGGSAGCRGRSAHGDEPALHHLLHAPLGVNGMWNTPVPVLATLFAPITLTAGPVAAYNVAMVLGPVVSGLALALALGVWIERWWPRAVAGLLYGFSPFMIAHQLGRPSEPGVGGAAAGAAVGAARHCSSHPAPRPWRTARWRGSRSPCRPASTPRPSRCARSVVVVVALVLAVRCPRTARGACRWPCAAPRRAWATYAVLCRLPAVPAARRARRGRARRSGNPRRRTPTRRTCSCPRADSSSRWGWTRSPRSCTPTPVSRAGTSASRCCWSSSSRC